MAEHNIDSHQINACNKGIEILAYGDTVGGACKSFRLTYKPKNTPWQSTFLHFQDGEIDTVGTNGLTHEALIAIVIDRLKGFQEGPWACPENAMAIEQLNTAMDTLSERTKLRDERGVEGTHEI